MIIPYNTYAAALLHSTGSGEFNQRIRIRAMTMGYHLSQHGLYRIVDGVKSEEPIPTKTEKEIFDILKVKMMAPEDRD
jgi:DNA polymerase/3'-5' exonuclease PolX